MHKLFIITNESICDDNGNFYCDNLDLKSTPEGLNSHFQVELIARHSKHKRHHKINLNNIKIHKNIISFIGNIVSLSKYKNSKFLIISLTPYTFVATLILKILKIYPTVYLRSDGFKEYKAILGFIGPVIYGIMFFIVSKISFLISCEEKILKKKDGTLVKPSQIDTDWFSNHKNAQLYSPNLLYVGRLKKEKGVFSLLKILNNSKRNFNLSIVGKTEIDKLEKIVSKNIKIFQLETDKKKLINYYDNHNIFILPSFTEGYPMVLLESLSRLRPVIIFKDIEHVAINKKGVFVANREPYDLFKKIDFILKNYKLIQDEIKENVIPTKNEFIKNLSELILRV